jgi:hypothetical protein
MKPPARCPCTCRHCLAHTIRRAVWQAHQGRPDVAGLMLYRVVEALERNMPPVCLRAVDRAVYAAEERRP